MKKKIGKGILVFAFIAIVIVAIVSTYTSIVTGEQYIKISTSKNACINSDLYVSVIVEDDDIEVESESKIRLLDSDGKEVKEAKVSYEGNCVKIEIPDIELGKYFIEAKVSSQAGKDIVKKEINIIDENRENVTITLDKGIYKPRRHCEF